MRGQIEKPPKPRCTCCTRPAKAWYYVIAGDKAEPEMEFCSQACAEEWARGGNEKLPRGTRVEKLEDL